MIQRKCTFLRKHVLSGVGCVMVSFVSSVPPLAKADSTKRLLSRSRHAPASHPANKPTKLGQVTGDPTDTGPKEPPILVTPSESFRYPLDPCFVFLQLYHASFLGPGHDKPQPLPDDEVSFHFNSFTYLSIA